MTPLEILQLCLRLNLTERLEACRDPDQKAQGKAIETTYTAIVDQLRSPRCPSLHIRALAGELWDTVGGKKVQIAMFDPIKTLHFAIHREPTQREVGMILIPPTWLDSLRDNPIFCVGGVVYTGSQAVSWHKLGRVDPRALKSRAQAYEAEYLLMIERGARLHRFDDYQRHILAMYPKGLASFEP